MQRAIAFLIKKIWRMVQAQAETTKNGYRSHPSWQHGPSALLGRLKPPRRLFWTGLNKLLIRYKLASARDGC
jgi:hypothetical protein